MNKHYLTWLSPLLIKKSYEVQGEILATKRREKQLKTMLKKVSLRERPTRRHIIKILGKSLNQKLFCGSIFNYIGYSTKIGLMWIYSKQKIMFGWDIYLH